MFAAARTVRRGAVRPKSILLIVVLAALGAGLYPIGYYAVGEYRYHQALAAIERKDFAEARRYLDACIRQWPDSAETRFLAARTARRAGDLESAQRLLKDAERLGWVRDAIDLERTLLMVQSGNHHAVSSILLEAVHRHHPDSLLILEVLTPATLRVFEMDVAIACLDAWVELEPNNAQVHLWRADICERLMRNNEAMDEYKQVLAFDPDNFDARRKYASILLNQKLPAESLTQYEWLLARKPNDPGLRRGYAFCLVTVGQPDKARPILDELLKLKADDGVTMLILGQLELDEGRPQVAEQWLRKAYQRLPSEPTVMYNLARCLEQNNKRKEAAQVRDRQKQFEEDQDQARQFFKEIMQKPYDPEPRRQLAIRLIRCGFEEDGKRWLESGLAQNPRYAPLYDTLADYYDRFGDLKMAAQIRQQAKDLQKQP
jgi:predicted Zn-dependent protease